MKWKITQTNNGYVIQYKTSLFSCWKTVNSARKFSFEPDDRPQYYDSKEEAINDMAKLITKYGGWYE